MRSTVQPAPRRLPGGQPQVLVHRQARPDPAALRHVADAEAVDLVRLQPEISRAVEADRAAARPLQAGDGVAQRGLAHAVAADDGEDAASSVEVDTLQGMAFAVEDLQGRRSEEGVARWPQPWPAPEIDVLNLGVGLDLVGRAFLEDPAVVHHRDVVRDPQRHVEVVLDDDVADMVRQRRSGSRSVRAARWATGPPPVRRTG